MTNDTDLSFEDDNGVPKAAAADQKPQAVKPGKAKKYVLSYDGKTSGLYKLYLLDFFMRIITIGIYSFWGKTRLRKYIWAHHSLAGDRFEYLGTGGELFKGFLKVLPILAILFVPIIMAEFYPILGLFYIPLIYCFGIAMYGAIRYRYSRTSWKGIRGYLDGSTIKYANLAFSRMLLNIITLGFAIPSSDIAKHKYIMDNSYFGTEKAEFNGTAKILFGSYIKSMLIVGVLIALIVGLIFLAIMSLSEAAMSLSFSGQEIYGVLITLGIIALALVFPIARSIYAAALMREKMRGLKVGHVKFMCTVTAGDLIKHRLANTLILIITLGLGFPYIVQRNIRFYARHHIIMGDLAAFEAGQAKDHGLTSGEGLEAGFDIDAGFF